MILKAIKKVFNKSPKIRSTAIHNLWENQSLWGWNVMLRYNDRKTWIIGHHPYRRQWDVGAEVRCKMKSGKIGRYRVVTFKPFDSPDDMFTADLQPIGYLDTSNPKEG